MEEPTGSCPYWRGAAPCPRSLPHELPGWYPALAPVTPAATWTAGDGEQDFHAACARLGPGPAVLRDYVKSMKHYWHQAAYIPDTADQALRADGTWRLIELGNGQISDRPASTDPVTFVNEALAP